MRAPAFFAAGASLLLSAMNAFAIAPAPNNALDLADVQAQKAVAANSSTLADPIYVNVGGDDIGSATLIPSLPYSDTGNTCSFASNYESCVGCFGCPYNPTGARDVVYAFTPAADLCVDIDLCSSIYDTKVYIGDGDATSLVACNDDACGTGLPGPWQSRIRRAQLLAGRTYYIIVDGYGSTDCGDYVMSMTDCGPCGVSCPPGAEAEGEPICHDNYQDSYNSGCEGVPPVFTNLICSYASQPIVVCGTYGGFFNNGLSYRDADWYQIILPLPATITWCVEGEYDTLCGIIDGNAGCPVTGFYDYNSGGGCTPVCVTHVLPAGTWWLWVGTLGFGPSAGSCGGNYVATLNGYWCLGDLDVEPATWGRIKGIYR